MNEKKKIIGVIMTYKHARFLEALYHSLPQGVYDEVIVTNDETGDGIEKIAERLGIPCFSHPRLGYGGNLKYGLKKGVERGGDYMVEIHGDGQFDVGISAVAVAKAREGYDFVSGSRFTNLRQPLRDKMPLIRYVANLTLSFLVRLVTGVKLSDCHNGFRVFSRRLIETLPLEKTSNDFLFAFEVIALTKQHRLGIAEIPIRAFYGQDHTSISIRRSIKFTFMELWSAGKYLLARLGVGVRPYDKAGLISFAKIFRYAISGAIAAAVNIVIFSFLIFQTSIWYLLASVISFLISFVLSFYLQKYWTFKDATGAGMKHQLAGYLLITLINLGVNVVLMFLFVEGIEMHPIVAKVITLIILALWSFFLYQKFIFKKMN